MENDGITTSIALMQIKTNLGTSACHLPNGGDLGPQGRCDLRGPPDVLSDGAPPISNILQRLRKLPKSLQTDSKVQIDVDS